MEASTSRVKPAACPNSTVLKLVRLRNHSISRNKSSTLVLTNAARARAMINGPLRGRRRPFDIILGVNRRGLLRLDRKEKLQWGRDHLLEHITQDRCDLF